MTHGGPATFGTAGAKWSGTTKLTGIYPDNKQWPAKMAIVRTQIAELFDSELLSSPGQNFQSRVKRAYRPVGHDGSISGILLLIDQKAHMSRARQKKVRPMG